MCSRRLVWGEVCWEVWKAPKMARNPRFFLRDWNGGVSASSTRENRPNFCTKRKLHWLQLLVNFEVWHVRFLGKGRFIKKRSARLFWRNMLAKGSCLHYFWLQDFLALLNKSGYIDTVQDSTGIRSGAVPRKGPIKIPSCLHLLSSWFKHVFLRCSWLPYNEKNLVVDGGFSWWLMVMGILH